MRLVFGLLAMGGAIWQGWVQVSGALTYMDRGASAADAFGGATPLLFAAAALSLAAGGRGLMSPRRPWATGVLAIALNGLILFLTYRLGIDRPGFIASALSVAAVLALLATPRNAR